MRIRRSIGNAIVEAAIAAEAASLRVTRTRTRHILSFNLGGRRPPLVFFPDVLGAAILGFRRFPVLFGPDQPVHLVEAVSAYPPEAVAEPTIEKIAGIYERELLDVLAPRPVVVGGFSFGALMAFELLRRLRARGFDVPLVVSFDGFAPGYPEVLPPPQRAWAHLRHFARGEGAGRWVYLRDRYDNLLDRVRGWLGQEHLLFENGSSMTPEMRRRFTQTFRVNCQAARRYRPTPVEGTDMLLIRAERPERWVGVARVDEVHGWGKFVGGRISVVTVPGDHTQILRAANHRLIVEAIRSRLPMGWGKDGTTPGGMSPRGTAFPAGEAARGRH
jgi:thioesterase domain-containing protein